MFTVSIYVHSVIRLFNFIRKLICTSLYIVLDDRLELAAIEDVFLKSPATKIVQRHCEARTYKDLVSLSFEGRIA